MTPTGSHENKRFTISYTDMTGVVGTAVFEAKNEEEALLAFLELELGWGPKSIESAKRSSKLKTILEVAFKIVVSEECIEL